MYHFEYFQNFSKFQVYCLFSKLQVFKYVRRCNEISKMFKAATVYFIPARCVWNWKPYSNFLLYVASGHGKYKLKKKVNKKKYWSIEGKAR